MSLKTSDISRPKDTIVECQKCGAKKEVNFAYCLKNGWDECCGYTMRMIKSTANIDETVKKHFNPLKLVMRRVGEHKYDAFCHCRECEAHRKFDADLNEMKFVK